MTPQPTTDQTTVESTATDRTDTTASDPDDRTTEPILETRDVEMQYDRVSVLDTVSMGVIPGELTALIGPNGAGKSTLIRILTGLETPTAGTVTYHGPETTRPIGYLPQYPAFRPGQSVLDAIEFYATLVGDSPEDALSHLETVGIADAAHRPIDALSGGMTRLVGIAQAIIGDPPVIILDEPASGLDPEMSVHIFDVLEDLSDSGTAILLSSHDLALVEEVCDRVVLLDGGQLAHRGRPETLVSNTDSESLLDVFRSSTRTESGSLRVQGVSDS